MPNRPSSEGPSRRHVLGVGVGAALLAPPAAARPSSPEQAATGELAMTLEVNGAQRRFTADVRTTLLDALRERLNLTGAKKGCDHGQCGACTVHIDGRRALACLTLAVAAQGRRITTIEGLSPPVGPLHPMQAAFIDADAFQCGYCTPGQIMSAVSCVEEGGAASREEIAEYMSGNLCRCGAYPHIVEAVEAAAARTPS